MCDSTEGTEGLVRRAECGHGESAGNCPGHSECLRTVEKLRRKGNPGPAGEDAKAETGPAAVIP